MHATKIKVTCAKVAFTLLTKEWEDKKSYIKEDMILKENNSDLKDKPDAIIVSLLAMEIYIM